MGVPGNANALLLASAAVSGGYQVSRSLRFNAGDSAYLNRTPASAGNRNLWTLAFWIKRCKFGTAQDVFSVGTSGTDILYFDSSDRLCLDRPGATVLVTTQVFRDPSAWYHIALRIDSTNGTNANKAQLYVNGSEVTTFSTDNRSGLTSSSFLTNTAILHTFGIRSSNTSTNPCDIYLADIYMVDGASLAPSSFTETDATTGQVIPKAYGGSYGSNGFKLSFSDNSTTAALGTDTSGNGNTWTTNNFSVTAGSGNDSLTDTPTSYGTDTGVGGSVRGNYCTWNPLISTSGPISNGNLEMVGANAWRNTKGTISVSTGKWYFEATYTGSQYGSALGNLAAGVGFCKSNTTTPNVDVNDSSLYGSILAFSQTGHVNNFNAPTSARSQIASGDVIGFALNYDAGTYTIYVNNTSTSSGSLNFTGELTPWTNAYYSGSYFILNTGQRAFVYTAPSGFKALVDTNLPAPVVAKPDEVFQTVLYTGNGASRSITGLNFAPDFLWIKNRNLSGYNHHLTDVVRGVTKRLKSNTAGTELTSTDQVTAYNSNGFSLGADSAGPGDLEVNQNTGSYVAWAWDAGTNTVTNNSGSISSQVRANASAGFSVVTYTVGSNISQTIGHGLGVAPQLLLVKERNQANNWQVYHASLGNGNFLYLNGTNASAANNLWNNTSPTSTVFSIRSGGSANFYDGKDQVCYAFAPVSGYSSFGSYTGGGTSGRFVYTGFRPKLIWVKNYNDNSYLSYTGWYMWDSVRGAYNYNQSNLNANSSNNEGIRNTGGAIGTIGVDLLSNGFCLRGSDDVDTNWGSGQYIYCAWAESPFQYARAR
jgi:hypothetical protein